MQISDFIQHLVDNKSNKFEAIIDSSIHNFTATDDYASIETQIENIDESKFTSFGDKISLCINYCEKKLVDCKEIDDDDYVNSIKSFLDTLNRISEIVVSVGKKYESKPRNSKNMSEALEQNKDVIAELNSRMGALKKDLNDTVKEADSRIDSKIFTLLINTVAILGIFVAIAFAGFGVTAIFSNLDLSQSLLCKEYFIKTVFFLLLIALLSYNLLLLLVYFIYQLSRPILNDIVVMRDSESGKILNMEHLKFSRTINLIPFFWVSGILFVLTLGFFIWCQFL